MIPALRTAQDPTRFALELIRTLMLLLCLVGWVMYPLELLLLDHWTEAWQSRIPFLVAVPGFVFTLWILFDRKTPWVRIGLHPHHVGLGAHRGPGGLLPPGLEHGRGH
jgi:hypothetical protein